MNCLVASRNHWNAHIGRRLGLMLLILWTCWALPALAQNTTQPTDASTEFSIRATHLLGFDNATSNCSGTLSIQDNTLQFRKNGESGAQVKIASIRGVFRGGESKQVGGLPMMLGKAAAPFGGGRAVSLFAHKNYDTVTLEYVDDDGGFSRRDLPAK